MKIATFNVNSVKARLDAALKWLRQAQPDVVCFQEIKCVDDAFPAMEFEAMGYTIATHGQKTYNGVALLSKHGLEDVRRGVPGFDDEQARYIEAVIAPKGGRAVRVASLYTPNGNPAPGPKYDYKLAWLRALTAHARALMALEEATVLAGDYNIIPEDDDVYDAKAWAEDALFRPESRAALRRLWALGLTDALANCNVLPNQYTFWDYQAGAWAKDHGLKIDHLLLSPQAADRLEAAGIDRHVRAFEKASDHVPVWCALAA